MGVFQYLLWGYNRYWNEGREILRQGIEGIGMVYEHVFEILFCHVPEICYLRRQQETMKYIGNIKIHKGAFDTPLELEHASVVAGFPSPADDYTHDTLDFNRDYIRHPEASFYGDVEGDSMKDAGIFDGDKVIIDRAVEPHDGSIVVAWWDGGFTMKYLDLTHQKDGYIELRPANPDFPVFKIDNPDNFEIWGTVIHLIRTFEK